MSTATLSKIEELEATIRRLSFERDWWRGRYEAHRYGVFRSQYGPQSGKVKLGQVMQRLDAELAAEPTEGRTF